MSPKHNRSSTQHLHKRMGWNSDSHKIASSAPVRTKLRVWYHRCTRSRVWCRFLAENTPSAIRRGSDERLRVIIYFGIILNRGNAFRFPANHQPTRLIREQKVPNSRSRAAGVPNSRSRADWYPIGISCTRGMRDTSLSARRSARQPHSGEFSRIGQFPEAAEFTQNVQRDKHERRSVMAAGESLAVAKRRVREMRTISQMIALYCARNHKTAERPATAHCGEPLCAVCAELDAYAVLRTQRCRKMDIKTSCEECGNYCYRSEMRERICQVMRYASPRMVTAHPVAEIRHLLGR